MYGKLKWLFATSIVGGVIVGGVLDVSRARADVLLSLNDPVTGTGYYNSGTEVFPLSNIDNGEYGDSGTPSHWSFWLTPNGVDTGYATINLQSVDTVDQLQVQDTHNRGFFDRGSDAFTISLSTNDVNWTTVVNSNFTVPQWQNLNILTFNVAPTQAQYVMYNFSTIYGGSSGGLGEMDVYGVPGITLTSTPEPGAYALFGGIGISGLAFLRRRRAIKPTA